MAGFDFHAIEERILAFWQDRKIFEKSMEQRRAKNRKRFVFYEGPPTANGHPHIGHFLTRIYKDLYGRYKTMRGFYVLRKAGWDTHGLPVELGVEKELGLKNKKQIEEYGIAAFNKKAKESVWRYKSEWEDMTRRMGFWVDLKHPYITYETTFIESGWSIFKTIWDKGLFYQAHRVVPYCTRCGTSLSAHEVAQGYKVVTDTSVFLKFKIKDESATAAKLPASSYILAWTTTPWTLPGNLALAVGKDIDYVMVKQDKEHFIIAKARVEAVLGSSAEIERELKGSDLAGLAYEPLFNVPQLVSEKSYKVYEADFVTTSDGTGVVHTAVMYGEDDYALGTKVGLPKVHTVDLAGKFVGVPEFEGQYVKAAKTEDALIASLEKNNQLLKIEPFEHEYPHCWRCDTPLLYYAKTSWFIKMSAINSQVIKNNQQVNWFPGHIKEGRFGQWLKEGKDWNISRERYWGTPIPVWQCVKCEHRHMVGSVEDLVKHSVGSGNTYYVLRHGLTTRDETAAGARITNSRLETDTYDLEPEGEKQIEKIVTQLGKLESIDAIYASPFRRTKQTAQIAGRILHQEVQEDDRLGEIRHAMQCEGKPHNQCEVGDNHNTFDHDNNGAESWDDVRRRMAGFIQELETKYRNKKILIVSHADPIWLLGAVARGLPQNKILEVQGTKDDWYPSLGGLKKLPWTNMPRNELGELDLHRPFIDEVVLSCEKCHADMHRIPDLADGWFDSGSMPYAQWHWPFENDKIFKQQFPADFIVEAIDQTRGWFYTLLAVSTLLDKGAPYKNVLVLGHTLDERGRKMSKSIGNVMSWAAPLDVAGVDATRWWLFVMSAPEESKALAIRDFEAVAKGFISTLENCMRFYELYKDQPIEGSPVPHLLDDWLLSRLNDLTAFMSERLDAYDPTAAARALERFIVDDFSNWWLRRSRKRTDALPLLRMILIYVSKLIAPYVPFMAEDMYLRLTGGEAGQAESVHLTDWPVAQKKLINKKLEEQMKLVQAIVTTGLAQRKDKQIKVRQPLPAITVTGKKFDADLELLIKDELNVKEIRYHKPVEGTSEIILDSALTPELLAEGYAREMMRQIQDMRKEMGYRFDDRVFCQWHTADVELSTALVTWGETIKKETALSEFLAQPHDSKKAYDIEKETDIAPGKSVWIGIKK